ncbi:hypothetical protein [Ruegeria sp. HKCCD8929]|uniref:hypothetical protein n=1 Tax=Ruegeria sp. HKCCD8929 TaxID=2683006 RepID=UPI001488BE4B|nr:hypothetical protein [Ruegeria sp. HKCCD8929]
MDRILTAPFKAPVRHPHKVTDSWLSSEGLTRGLQPGRNDPVAIIEMRIVLHSPDQTCVHQMSDDGDLAAVLGGMRIRASSSLKRLQLVRPGIAVRASDWPVPADDVIAKAVHIEPNLGAAILLGNEAQPVMAHEIVGGSHRLCSFRSF